MEAAEGKGYAAGRGGRSDLGPVVKCGPAPVEFLTVCNNNLDKAQRMYEKSEAWKLTHDIANILSKPQPHFDTILKYYPHGIHGRSLDNCIVMYEVLGQAKPRELTAQGVSAEMLVWHFVLRNEYVFQRVFGPTSNSSPMGQIMTVLDVKNIAVGDITGGVISFIKQSAEIMDGFYPGRVARLVICNAPVWFYSVWSMVARVLPESVNKKIAIINNVEGLDKFISPSQRPRQYGGTDTRALGESAEHLGFVQLADQWQAAAAAGLSKSSKNADNNSSTSSKQARDSDSDSASGSSPAQQKKSVLQWLGLSSHNNNNNSNYHDSTDKHQGEASVAYLGEKNAFRFDSNTGTWVIDSSSESSASSSVTSSIGNKPTSSAADDDKTRVKSSCGRAEHTGVAQGGASLARPASAVAGGGGSVSGAMTQAQLEEHGVVLAIQAAHLASASRYRSSSASDVSSLAADRVRDAQSHHSNNSASHSHSKLSPHVLLIVLAMFSALRALSVSLQVLVPMWLYSPLSSGGAGYTVIDMGLVWSFASFLLWVGHHRWRHRLQHTLVAAPLKALRLVCLVTVMVALLLSWLLTASSMTSQDVSQSALPSSSSSPVTSGMQLLMGTAVLSRPSVSFISLVILGLLLALLISCVFVGEMVTEMLLNMVLAPVLSSTPTVGHFIGSCLDLAVPCIACYLYQGTVSRHSHRGSLFLGVSSLACIALYMLTLTVNIQYIGDFGVIQDKNYSSSSSSTSSSSSSSNLSPTPTSSSGSKSKFNSTSTQSAGIAGLGLLDVIGSDLAVLLTSGSVHDSDQGYGSKLHNLKIDMKSI